MAKDFVFNRKFFVLFTLKPNFVYNLEIISVRPHRFYEVCRTEEIKWRINAIQNKVGILCLTFCQYADHMLTYLGDISEVSNPFGKSVTYMQPQVITFSGKMSILTLILNTFLIPFIDGFTLFETPCSVAAKYGFLVVIKKE